MVNLNVKNFLMVTLIAILGIVLFKVIFTKFQIKGVSQLVQSV
jgi:hypothetical protein